jgi:hypothetical protein
LVSKTDHAQLFLRIEPLDFLDDFARGHVESVSQIKVTINLTLVCRRGLLILRLTRLWPASAWQAQPPLDHAMFKDSEGNRFVVSS